MGDRAVWEIEEEMGYHQEEGNVGAVMDLVDEIGNMQDRLFREIANGDLGGVMYFESLGFDLADPAYLVAASQFGDCKIIDYLIQQKSDIHSENDLALFTAAVNGKIDAVRLLVSLGADVHALDERAAKIAAKNDFLDIVQYLVGAGASVDAILGSEGLADRHKEVYEWAQAYKRANDLKETLEVSLDEKDAAAPKIKV